MTALRSPRLRRFVELVEEVRSGQILVANDGGAAKLTRHSRLMIPRLVKFSVHERIAVAGELGFNFSHLKSLRRRLKSMLFTGAVSIKQQHGAHDDCGNAFKQSLGPSDQVQAAYCAKIDRTAITTTHTPDLQRRCRSARRDNTSALRRAASLIRMPRRLVDTSLLLSPLRWFGEALPCLPEPARRRSAGSFSERTQ